MLDFTSTLSATCQKASAPGADRLLYYGRRIMPQIRPLSI